MSEFRFRLAWNLQRRFEVALAEGFSGIYQYYMILLKKSGKPAPKLVFLGSVDKDSTVSEILLDNHRALKMALKSADRLIIALGQLSREKAIIRQAEVFSIAEMMISHFGPRFNKTRTDEYDGPQIIVESWCEDDDREPVLNWTLSSPDELS